MLSWGHRLKCKMRIEGFGCTETEMFNITILVVSIQLLTISKKLVAFYRGKTGPHKTHIHIEASVLC